MSYPPALRLLRPRQWVKNAFVAAPLFFTPQAVSRQTVLSILLGMIAFSALASAVYIINDYMDRKTDRLHPTKRHRPLAAGTVSIRTAFLMLAGLLVGGFALAVTLSPGFAAIAGIYLAVNLAYSTVLKHVSIIDVMLVALGYVLRVYAGAELIHVPASVWIIACTGLVSMFIALAKRRDDLVNFLGEGHRGSLKGYTKEFLDTAIAITLAGLLISYVIYTTLPDSMHRFGTEHLYFTTPFVFMGVLRYLQIALVEERSGSPTTIVLSDRFLIGSMLAWLVTFGILIYA